MSSKAAEFSPFVTEPHPSRTYYASPRGGFKPWAAYTTKSNRIGPDTRGGASEDIASYLLAVVSNAVDEFDASIILIALFIHNVNGYRAL